MCVVSRRRDKRVMCVWLFFVFFFQAEDGIRDWSVTGVQTFALPIGEGVGFHEHELFTEPKNIK